ncbi:MAG: DUF4124 domain-containing protein [Myxococcota bacterium]|nr:DUF4124 domain-containing protein [Myxococcota bacterium]
MNPRALAMLICLSPAALGGDGVYRWVDANGEVHYTNDLQSLPGDVVLTPVEGEALGELTTHRPQAPARLDAPPASPQKLELARVVAETRRAQAEARAAELEVQRGLREEEEFWRGAFRDARRRILLLQDSLQREKALFETSGLPVTLRIHQPYGHPCVHRNDCGSAEQFEKARLTVQELERDLSLAEGELAELERRASHQAVPLEWRR